MIILIQYKASPNYLAYVWESILFNDFCIYCINLYWPLTLCTIWSVLQLWTRGYLGQSESLPGTLICRFNHTNWSMCSRNCLGKSLDLSKIPNWRTPLAINQIFCYEGSWKFSQSQYLKWVCYLYLVSKHLGSFWTAQDINDFIIKCTECMHNSSPSTQLHHNYSHRTNLDFNASFIT